MNATSDRLLQAIQDELTEGRLVPVVGAGISKQVAEIPGWRGVIKHGIRYIEESHAASEAELNNARRLLATGKLIPTAERVRKLLGAPDGEFPAWLANLFGVTRAAVPTDRTHAIDSIINLQCRVIATTNYDKLLSELHYDYFPGVTWLEPPLMQTAVRDGKHVLHLHGVYDKPDSVIFGRSDYKRIVDDEAYRMVLETLWLHKTMLFVGCSFDGLKDPDFSRLLTWASKTFKGTRYKHYALVRAESYTPGQARQLLNKWRIQVVPFGNDYSELPSWLDAMNPNLAQAQAIRAQRTELTQTVGNGLLPGITRITSIRAGVIPQPADTPSVPDIPRYIQFVRQTVEDAITTHPLTLHEAPSALEARLYTMSVTREDSDTRVAGGILLSTAIERSPHLALVGEPGSGKSQMLRQEALAACAEFERAGEPEQDASSAPSVEPTLRVPVLTSLNGYNGQPIIELIRETFRMAGVEIDSVAIEHMARDGKLYLLLDDLDWVRPEYAPGLLTSLKSWRRMHSKCRLAVSSQRVLDGHRLEIPTYTVSPLVGDEVSTFLTGALGLKDEDVIAIREGLPHEFRDLLSLPLTLKMLALVYQRAEHTVPESRSALYGTCVQILLDQSEARGHVLVDRSDKLRLLSLLARWMQDSSSYRPTPSDLGSMLYSWITDTENKYGVGHLRNLDMLQLRTELLQSELFRFTADGEIEFIHRTFTAYLAALVITTGELAELLDRESWTTSLLLWASMHPLRTTDALMPLLATKPVLLGMIIKERAAQRKIPPSGAADPDSSADARQWFSQFVRIFNGLFEQFQVLGDPRWETAIPPGKLEAVVAASEEGYALIWRGAENAPQDSVVWVDSTAHANLITNLRRQMPWQMKLALWSFPQWLLNKYHPLEAAYNWVLRLLLDRLVLTPWVWNPEPLTLPGAGEVHPLVERLMERHVFYRNFVEGLPFEVQERLPFYAQSGFTLIADIDESPQNPTIVHTFLPSAGTEMRVFQQVFDSSTGRGDPPLLIRGADDRWTTTIDGLVQPVLKLSAWTLDHALEQRPSEHAQKWLLDDLEKCLPGFPSELW